MKTYSYFVLILRYLGVYLAAGMIAWLLNALTLGQWPPLAMFAFIGLGGAGYYFVARRGYPCPKCGGKMAWPSRNPSPPQCRNCGHFPWRA